MQPVKGLQISFGKEPESDHPSSCVDDGDLDADDPVILHVKEEMSEIVLPEEDPSRAQPQRQCKKKIRNIFWCFY